jgi:hypothetical protein
MSKHTPGPWIAFPSNTRWISGAFDPIFKNGLWHVVPASKPERLPICTVDYADDHHEPTREKAEADARLIAAAPDLLEALQGLVAWADELRRQNPEEDLRKARAAIAKATGEQA